MYKTSYQIGIGQGTSLNANETENNYSTPKVLRPKKFKKSQEFSVFETTACKEFTDKSNVGKYNPHVKQYITKSELPSVLFPGLDENVENVPLSTTTGSEMSVLGFRKNVVENAKQNSELLKEQFRDHLNTLKSLERKDITTHKTVNNDLFVKKEKSKMDKEDMKFQYRDEQYRGRGRYIPQKNTSTIIDERRDKKSSKPKNDGIFKNYKTEFQSNFDEKSLKLNKNVQALEKRKNEDGQFVTSYSSQFKKFDNKEDYTQTKFRRKRLI